MKENESYISQFGKFIKAAKGAIKGIFKQDLPIEKTLEKILKKAKKTKEISPGRRKKMDEAVEKHLKKMYAYGVDTDDYQSLAVELDKANKIIAEINKFDHAWSIGMSEGIKVLVQDIKKYQRGKEEGAKNINFDMNKEIGRINEYFNVKSVPIYAKIISLGLTGQELEQKVGKSKLGFTAPTKAPPLPPPAAEVPAPPPPPPQMSKKSSHSEGVDSPKKKTKKAKHSLKHKKPSKRSEEKQQDTPPRSR